MVNQALAIISSKTLETSDVLMVCVVGIAVVILELALIAFCITGVSKAINKLTKATKKVAKAAKGTLPVDSAPAVQTQTVAPAQKTVVLAKPDPELIAVDEKTAAIIMAIVSHESGIGLDRLAFKSIKKVD